MAPTESAPTADIDASEVDTPGVDTPGVEGPAEDSPSAEAPPPYPQEVEVLEIDGRRIVLVGTAHISQHSVELVRRVIEQEKPDRVCVELDPQRYESLRKKKQWESLDLKEIIRRKQMPTLIVNLLLAAFQKRLGGQLGVEPGSELLEATKAAEEHGIPIELCDRDVRATLRRAGAATPFFRKLWLFSELLASLFESPEISEEQLQELKEKDTLSELMEAVGEQYPDLKTVLIDERDDYLKETIKRSEGNHLVAVVGAGHLKGIREALLEDRPVDLEKLSEIPPASPWPKRIGWAIPILILSLLGYVAFSKGPEAAGESLMIWVLANGIPTALGAILAAGHPLTVLAGFVAAPITSLSPLVGAHYVTAFVQAYLRPPVVKEFKTLSEDVATLRGWWGNKLLRIFLNFILPALGSVIGTFVGGSLIAKYVL